MGNATGRCESLQYLQEGVSLFNTSSIPMGNATGRCESLQYLRENASLFSTYGKVQVSSVPMGRCKSLCLISSLCFTFETMAVSTITDPSFFLLLPDSLLLRFTMSGDEHTPGSSSKESLPGPSSTPPPAVGMSHILSIIKEQVAQTITSALTEIRESPPATHSPRSIPPQLSLSPPLQLPQ